MRNYIYVHKDDIIYNEGVFEPLPEEDFNRLKESIRENGIIVPIVVVEDKGNKGKYILLDGRNRYRAASELGYDLIPAEVLDVTDHSALVLQYDLELCRRHLNKDVIDRKWKEERNYYAEKIKKSLRGKIFQTLKIEDTEVIRKHLDSMPLNELEELNDTLQRISSLSNKLTNNIAKQIAYKIYTVTKNEASEEVEKAIKAYYEKQLEELYTKLQEREEEILSLKDQIEELSRAKKELEEKYEEVRKAKVEELNNYIKEKTKEYDEKINELKQQLLLEKAKKHSPEEIKKLTEELRKEFEKEIKAKEEEFRKEESEWRRKIEELQTGILKLNKKLESVEKEKKSIEEELRAEIAEKQRIKTRLDNLLIAYREATSERALLNLVKLLKEQLHLTLQVAYNIASFNQEYISQIKHVWKDVNGLYEQLKDYIEKTIIPAAGTPSQNQTSDQNA